MQFCFPLFHRGVCSSVTGLASSVARNLHEFSMDEEHIRRTRANRMIVGTSRLPVTARDGLRLGVSEFVISLLGGLAGIAHQPLQALIAHEGGTSVSEVASSVGRGLVGVVAKPLAGAADLVAMTGTGLLQGMGTSWGVPTQPAHLGRYFLLFYPYSCLNIIMHVS